MPTDTTQTDPSIVALMHGLKTAEGTNGNYNATGDSGTAAGIGQWSNQINGQPTKLQAGEIPSNFKGWATEYGLNPDDFSPENQNKVMYARLAADKKSGLTPEQILSKWNSGDPNKYNNPATSTGNGAVGPYDVAGYVKRGMTAAQSYAQQNKTQTSPSGYPTQPLVIPDGVSTTNGPESPIGSDNQGFIGGTVSDISKRVTEGTNAAAGGINAALHGDVGGAVSGLIQTAGAAGGAVGDVTNRALELVPGVKQLEGLLGQGVGYLASTPTGQTVAKAIQDWSDKNPELAKDVGAGFNIATAIPIFKGLSVLKNIAGDAAAQALKGVAEKGALKDLTTAASRTVGGRTALARNPEALKTIIDERAIPDIEGGKYDVTDARAKLGDAISNVEDNELQPTLAKANSPATSSRIPLEQYKKSAMQDAVDQLKDTGPVEKYFERLKTKYGDYPTLQQMNEAKRLVSRNISEAGFNSPTYSTDKIVRSSLQKSVEDGAKALGLDDVAAINLKMANLIKAQDMLDYIDRKPVNIGMTGGVLRDVATGAGEMAGNATGLPLVGALAGREAGGRVAKKLASITTGVLKRTGKDAVTTPIKGAVKKATKGVLYAQAQKATKGR